MSEVRFRVDGTPVAQPRPRVSVRNGVPRGYVPAKHPIHSYRDAVAIAAARAGLTHQTGKVRVSMFFLFPRPQSHYTRSGAVKDDAPILPRPDIDNLVKGVLDALAPWFDDKLVANANVVKDWIDPGQEYTEVVIW